MGHQVGQLQQESEEVSVTLHPSPAHAHTCTNTYVRTHVYERTHARTHTHSCTMVCESTIQCLAPYRWGQDYHARKEKLQAENQELQVHTNCWATLCSVQVLSSTADSALCVSTPPQYIIIHKSTRIRTYLPSYVPIFQFLTSIHPFIHTCTYT